MANQSKATDVIGWAVTIHRDTEHIRRGVQHLPTTDLSHYGSWVGGETGEAVKELLGLIRRFEQEIGTAVVKVQNEAFKATAEAVDSIKKEA